MNGTMRLLRRCVALGAVLAVTAVAIPNAGVRSPDAALVRVNTAEGVDHPSNVVWILALGSDARKGQSITRSRADAIQLVGLNLETGSGVNLEMSGPGAAIERREKAPEGAADLRPAALGLVDPGE